MGAREVVGSSRPISIRTLGPVGELINLQNLVCLGLDILSGSLSLSGAWETGSLQGGLGEHLAVGKKKPEVHHCHWFVRGVYAAISFLMDCIFEAPTVSCVCVAPLCILAFMRPAVRVTRPWNYNLFGEPNQRKWPLSIPILERRGTPPGR